MYKSELDKHIQNNTISNNFVLFGESIFLIDYYTKLLSNAPDVSVLTFYFDEYNFASAKAHLSQASLFGDRSLLIIKSEKKIPKADLDALIALCEKNPDNIFIYAYYGSDHKTYAKAFAKTSNMSVRFFHPKDFEAQNIVLEIAKEKGVMIDKFSISHLLNIHNGDVALAANEIEKFKCFDKTISTKDIDELVFGLGEVNLDEFIKKILAKKDFREDVNNILEHGEDEIRILTSITSYITQLYMFNIYIRINGAPNALEILGYPAPPQIVNEKAQLSLKLKPLTYFKLHELLLESELKMKSSHVDKGAILLSTLLKMQQML
jgi:DNA polymerase-3 subunit delta